MKGKRIIESKKILLGIFTAVIFLFLSMFFGIWITASIFLGIFLLIIIFLLWLRGKFQLKIPKGVPGVPRQEWILPVVIGLAGSIILVLFLLPKLALPIGLKIFFAIALGAGIFAAVIEIKETFKDPKQKWFWVTLPTGMIIITACLLLNISIFTHLWNVAHPDQLIVWWKNVGVTTGIGAIFLMILAGLLWFKLPGTTKASTSWFKLICVLCFLESIVLLGAIGFSGEKSVAEKIMKQKIMKPRIPDIPTQMQQVQTRREVVVQPAICANQYDFSNLSLPKKGEDIEKVLVEFRPDCWTRVTLPPRANYTEYYSTDAEVVFLDGSTYINGPGRHVWYGVHTGKMKIRGLKGAGTVEFSLEKRS